MQKYNKEIIEKHLLSPDHLFFINLGNEVGLATFPDARDDEAYIRLTSQIYNYVLYGAVKVCFPKESAEYEFKAGDLFVIEPGAAHCCKADADSRILFWEVYGRNDNNPSPLSDGAEQWSNEYIKVIRANDIEDVLKPKDDKKIGSIRVYLCGNLQKENGLSHIQTESFEIGITDYASYTFETAHKHTNNHEYNYVLTGAVKVLLLKGKTEHEFKAGDLFVIEPGEEYVGKQAPGTRVLFSKYPGGNDKINVAIEHPVIDWGESWDKRYED